MQENNNIIYAYIKGNRYKSYKAIFDGNENLNVFDEEFDTLDGMLAFLLEFSDMFSVPVQFYK